MSDSEKVLILGQTGKLGQALAAAFAPTHEVVGASRADGLDAGDFAALERRLEQVRPRLLLNAVALGGLDDCERDPAAAFRLNALLPQFLAKASRELDFTLVHFSSDAVFSGQGDQCYRESDPPCPINVYGLTKFGGDCFVQCEAGRFYIFRLALLAGAPARKLQLVERLIETARAGGPLRIADDVVCSPSYAKDIAQEVERITRAGLPFGLYHLANAGRASLHAFVVELMGNLGLDVPITAVKHAEFATLSRKNLVTPLCSEKLAPLRTWQEALRDYCASGRGPDAA